MFFADGYNAELLNNLSVLLESGRIPHAIILDGGTEQQRQILAKKLAGAIICTGKENEKPCGKCVACKKAIADSHPDIITVEAEEKKKTISIEIIRKMRDDAYVLPNEANKKIYIIKQAQTMQPYAQNALLKVLEEPPKYASFILLCEYHTELLPTVLSRCVVFNIEESAQNESTEQGKETELAQKISAALAEKSEFDLLMLTAEFEKNADLLQACLVSLELILRDAMVLAAGGNKCISSSKSSAELIARCIEKEQIIKLIEANRIIISQSQQHANNNLTITRLCSTLIQAVQNR
ncbi:MAG: hypothetical protein RR069_00400 [Oscillospiraceae bacterium]